MTKIFFIHPSVHDVKSFLTFTFLETAVDSGTLEWDENAPDILFASEWTFYRRDLFEKFRKLYPKARLKVAWMGEAVSADFNVFDYAIGFDKSLEGNPRFIRLLSPLDMYHRFLSQKRNDETNVSYNSKPGFCNFLYSNPEAHPMRDSIFYALNAFRHVDSLGKHLNNTGTGGTGYGGHYEDATLLKTPYRFSIAAENAEYDGYTSEKIFTSLAAHTVPVYWGNPSIEDDVNCACFINVRDFSDLDSLVRYVAEVDADPKLWESYVSQPWLTPDQERHHAERTAAYCAGMARILSGDAPKAAPEGCHVEMYRRQFFKRGFRFGKGPVLKKESFRHKLRGKALGALELLSPALGDRVYMVLKYRLMIGKWPDLKCPQTFNEKIQAAKLYDRNPLYTKLVDKAAVKDWVASRVGAGYVIPTLGAWESFDAIDFDALPGSFVLKCTHDSGSVVVVRDKAGFDRAAASARLSAALRRDYSRSNREWPYRGVPRRIIAEPYLKDLEGCTDDYKFFCADGKVRFLFVATGRGGGDAATRFDFFDPLWNHLPLTNGHPNADIVPARPDNFEEMKALASRLSEGLPFVRVDLYNIDGRILFGEFTFSHWGGFKPFDPPEWDLKLGQMISGQWED